MQLASKRIGAIVAAVCMAVALAFGAIAAWADGSWWTHPAEGDSLTVAAASSDKDFIDDLSTAQVVVDIYRIASATPHDKDQAFDYSLISSFNTEELAAAISAGEWQALADGAAKLVTPSETGTAQMSLVDGVLKANITGLDDGLFLVIAHGPGSTEAFEVTDPETQETYKVYKAYSDMHEYLFRPTVVALPSKAPDENGVIRTDDSYGEWLSNVEIAMKPSQGDRYGKLRITKTVADSTQSKLDSTFTFHIVGTTPEGAKQGKTNDYDNYAQVMYTNGEVQDAVITMIPAGTTGTVYEVNPGAGFESETVVGEFTIVVDDENMATVKFKNTRLKPQNPTYGIQNNFEATDVNADGNVTNWSWSANEEANAHGPE